MLRDEIIEAVEAVGFDEYREIDAADLIFADAVFASCKQNTCGNYGKNHSCPPLSGDMEKNKSRFLKYDHAIILNKLAHMGDFYEKMEEAGKEVAATLNQLREKLDGKAVMIAGPGGCDRCDSCAAKEDEPCRFPDEKRYSMEGSGLDIVSMSRKENMTYNGGNNTLGFFMMVLY